jgi:hypothetical protein
MEIDRIELEKRLVEMIFKNLNQLEYVLIFNNEECCDVIEDAVIGVLNEFKIV